jgi:cysteine-rich repeat protein
VHPFWWGALALMAFNDHVLKAAGLLPGVVTGKLSDLAGLVVAPALLATLLRVRSRRALLVCYLAVAVVFAGIQLSPPFAAGWSAIMGLVGAPWVIVCDPTDLLALPMLLVAWRVLTPVMVDAPTTWLERGGEQLLAIAGLLFCIATGDTDEPAPGPPRPEGCIDSDGDGVCAEIDCDDSDPSYSESCCIDDDADGICSAFDCNDNDASIFDKCEEACDGAITSFEGVTAGDTSVAPDQLVTTCDTEGGPEAAHGFVVAGETGVLQLVTASVVSDTPHVIAARTVCALDDSELSCAGDETAVLAAPGTTLWVIVEAASDLDAGPYELTLLQEPVVCGDGLVVGPEQCDDGNLEDGDGCDALCNEEVMP